MGSGADTDPGGLGAAFDAMAVTTTDGSAIEPVLRLLPGPDLCCGSCGYGVATDPPPGRCPMCNSETDWVERTARRGR